MNPISLLPQDIYQHTLIENYFIDTYLPKANGDYVKVYIFILRMILNGQFEFTPITLAKKLHLIESDVIRALKYWHEINVIDLEFEDDEIKSIGMKRLSNDDTHNTSNKKNKVTNLKANIYKRPTYTMEEMALISEQSDFRDLLYITEKYLGKQLTQTDVNTLLGFIDWLGLPIDVVEYLVEFCVSNNHRHMNYIEKVAIDWSDGGIKSLEQAKAKSSKSSNYYNIMSVYGISGRAPTSKEVKYMDKWLGTFNFSMAMIKEACERTLSNTHDISFPYTDSILENWHKNKVHTLDELQPLDIAHKASKKVSIPKKSKYTTANPFHNHNQRTYDYTALESRMSEVIKSKVQQS